MAPIKQNESPNLETTKASVETKNNQNDSLKLAKEDVLKAYKGYDLFKQSLLSDPNYKKDEILQILEKVDEMDLQMYLDSNVYDGNLVNLKVKDFIDNFKGLIVEKKEEKKIDLIINSDDAKENSKNNEVKETSREVKETSREVKETSETSTKIETAQGLLNKNIDKYKKVFTGTEFEDTFLSKVNKVTELSKNSNEKTAYVEAYKDLINWLEQNGNAQKIFDTISTSKNISEEDKKSLYTETYSIFVNLGITNLPERKELPPVEIIPKDPRFPDAPEGKVEKRGDLVTYGDKTIDERTGKAYIISDNGYRLETSLNVPNMTEMKVEHQEKRLELLETINTDKRILELLGNKKKIKQDIADLEKQKKGGLGEDTGINIAINLLQKELEQIQAKLAVAVPNYKENQDDLLTSFLENSIKENEEKLNTLEKKYRKDLSELYEKSADKVRENDETTRRTTLLLDSIGFTLIPQHITDDIIATINKNPEAFGFDSRIDLKNGNFGGINNIATKERFIKKFNKMISGKEGEPITSEDINNILVKKLEKDKDSQGERNKELLAKFSTYNIMSDLGTWDREKLESNLTLKEKETTNKETK